MPCENFETAKVLKANGDELRLLGSFNLPPHIRDSMNQLIRSECLLHLSYFLDIITETTASKLYTPLRSLHRGQELANVVEIANPARMAALSLTSNALDDWANLAFALQRIAKEYEPKGNVASIDVFNAIPLGALAQSKKNRVEGPLSKWQDFIKEAQKYHEVGRGTLYHDEPRECAEFCEEAKIGA